MPTEILAPSIGEPDISLKARAAISRRRRLAESDFIEALLPFTNHGPDKRHITPIVSAYALELFSPEAENYRTDQRNQLSHWLNILARSIEDEIAQLRYVGSISGSLPQMVLGHLYHDGELRRIVRESLKSRIGDLLSRCGKDLDGVAEEQGPPAAKGPSIDEPVLSLKTRAAISRHRRLAESDFIEALLPFTNHRPDKGRIALIVSAYALQLFNPEAENYRTDQRNQLSHWLNILRRSIEDEVAQLRSAGSISGISGSLPQMVLGRLYHDGELRRIVRESLKGRIGDILNRCGKDLDIVAEERGTPTAKKTSEDKSTAITRTVRSTSRTKNLSGERPGRPRGRRPKRERRSAIKNAILRRGENWRDHLDKIFQELDEQQIDLGRLAGFAIQLGDGHEQKAWQWCDLGLAIGRQRVSIIDTLRKYVQLIPISSN